LKAERDENTCRKDLSPLEAVAIGKELEKFIKPEAEKRMLSGKKNPRKNFPRVSENGKARDKVGKSVGLSPLNV